jgi:hypothetical protein
MQGFNFGSLLLEKLAAVTTEKAIGRHVGCAATKSRCRFRLNLLSDPLLQQSASLYRQRIQRHLQLRDGDADFRVFSDLLLQRL